MSEYGATLQTYNQELVKCLEELKVKRDELIKIIHKQRSEKSIIEKKMKALQEEWNTIHENLEHNKELLNQYEKTIQETDNGFRKILESSQALLHLAQHETIRLDSSSGDSSQKSGKT